MLAVTKMKYLKRIEGVTRRDKIRNEFFREKLKILPIMVSKMEHEQLRLLEHGLRLEDSSIRS